MTRSILRRLVLALAILLAVNAASYLVVYVLNARWAGTFGGFFLGNFAGNFGTDNEMEPIGVVIGYYMEYLGQLATGNAGTHSGGTPVGLTIADALPKSLILLGLALIASAVAGVLLGLVFVDGTNRRVGALALVVSVGGYAMPGFFLAILLMYAMLMLPPPGGGRDYLLPVIGYGLDAHLVLPLIALSARPTAEVARLTAELLAGELDKPYVRTARAKGLPWRLVVLRHALRNVAATVVVTLGNALRYLISSLLVIEWLYQWPGLGWVLIRGITGSPTIGFEPALVAGVLTTIAGVILITDAVTETSVGLLDPRLKRQAVEV